MKKVRLLLVIICMGLLCFVSLGRLNSQLDNPAVAFVEGNAIGIQTLRVPAYITRYHFQSVYGRFPDESVSDQALFDKLKIQEQSKILANQIRSLAEIALEKSYRLTVSDYEIKNAEAASNQELPAATSASKLNAQIQLKICNGLEAVLDGRVDANQAYAKYVDTESARTLVKDWMASASEKCDDSYASSYLSSQWHFLSLACNTKEGLESLRKQAQNELRIIPKNAKSNSADVEQLLLRAKLMSLRDVELSDQDAKYKHYMSLNTFDSKSYVENAQANWFSSKLKTLDIRIIDAKYNEAYQLVGIDAPAK